MVRAALVVTVTCAAAVAYGDPERDGGEVIVVTGSRMAEPARDEAASVEVIGRDALDREPARLADDILRTLPAVGTFRRSSSAAADPTSQGLNLRGIGPSAVSRALVLQDGVPLVDPFGGWVYWRAIDPLVVDRVEVQAGAASALFGNYALGGVIALESRPIDRDAAHVVIAGGLPASERIAAAVSQRYGRLALAFDGEGFHSKGFDPIASPGAVDHDAATSHGSAGARASYRAEHAEGHAALRWFDETLDAGTVDTTADVRTLRGGTGGSVATGTGLYTLELFGGAQHFAQDRARISAGRATAVLASHQVTPSDDQGGSLTWQPAQSEHHRVLAGIDARHVAGTATDHLDPPAMTPASLIERSAGGAQWFGGVFAEDAIRATPRLVIAPALRLDGSANTGAQTTITHADGTSAFSPLAGRSDAQLDPRLGVLYRASDELALRAAGYRGFRAPTLNELYRPFQVGTILTDANADLHAETLWGGEAGAELALAELAARATVFVDRLASPVDNVTLPMPLADGAQRVRENLGAARVAGIELAAEWHPAAAWTASVAELFADTTVTSAPGYGELVGKRLAQDPRHRAIATLAFADPKILSAVVQVRYLGAQFEDDQNTLPIGAVVLADAFVSRRIGRGFVIFATVENALDRRYIVGRSGVDTVGAPRTIELGVRFDAE
jgi:outer membrane receptor protein involved in Fe transport